MAKWKEYRVPGPAELVLSRADVASLLGVSEDTVGRMVADGRFPRGAKPSPGTEPVWSGLDLACWLHLASRMHADARDAGKKSGD